MTQQEKISRLKEGLLRGPVCISVTAWYQNEQGLYYSPQGLNNGHWCLCYKIDETGIYVFDSYQGNDPYGLTQKNLKKLTLDHNIQFAKVYFFTVPTVQQNWLSAMIRSLLETVGLLQKKQIGAECVVTPTPVKLDWKDKLAVRHSIRVMCDEAGLSVKDKNIICACIQQESGFDPRAIGKKNKDGTTDYGLCQFNTGQHPITKKFYWIGPGADFKDIEEVLSDPEKNVRVMIREFKKGHIGWWASFSTGAYKKYL